MSGPLWPKQELVVRMRVLQFFKTYYPDSYGGIEQVIFQLSQAMSTIGVETDVLALSRNPARGPASIGSHRTHYANLDFEIASTGLSSAAIGKFCRLAAEADIVHYHYPWPYMDLVHFIARSGKPTVVTYHSDIIRQKRLRVIYRPIEKLFFNSVDAIVPTSPNYGATSSILRPYQDKLRVIPIGIDEREYPEVSQERRSYWRRSFGERFFLFVGMLRYYKGLHVLLDAIPGAEYKVLIVGAGPIERDLRAQAAHLKLNNVHFLGALPDEDKVALLDLAVGAVFPSHMRAEAFGVFLLEAAMFAKPLISSEIGTGTSFVNVDGETGIVIHPGDPSALRRAMDYIWTHPDEAARLGKNARARYENLFTAQTMAKAYLSLYRSILAKRHVDTRRNLDVWAKL
jgi:O-antigen biosynthesis rhamnosyltransferase